MPRADIVKEYLDVRRGCFDKETIRKAFRKCGIHPLDPNIFTDVDFSPSENTSTVGHAPSSYPVYDPWYHENGLDANGRDDLRPDIRPAPGIAEDQTGMVGGESSGRGGEEEVEERRDVETADDEGVQVRESVGNAEGERSLDDEGQIEAEGTEGDGSVEEIGGDQVANENNERMDAPMAAPETTLPRLRSQASRHPHSAPHPTSSTPSSCSSLPARNRRPRGRYKQISMIDRRPKATILSQNDCLKHERSRLENENLELKAKLRRTEAHSKLMFGENEKLRKRLDAKKTKRTTKNLVTEARLLNGREGMAEWEAQEAERVEEERKKDATRAVKEAKDHERQQNREQNAHMMRFSGVLTRKPKDDLRDIAWAFGLLDLGFDHRSEYAKKRTVIALKTDIQSFLESHRSDLEGDERYAGLYYKKRARPVDSVAPQEPLARRLRLDTQQSDETQPPAQSHHFFTTDMHAAGPSSLQTYSQSDFGRATHDSPHQSSINYLPPLAGPRTFSTARSPLTGHRYSPHSNCIRRYEDIRTLLPRPNFTPPSSTHNDHSTHQYPFPSQHIHHNLTTSSASSPRLTPNMFCSQSVAYSPLLEHDPTNPFV